MYFNHPNASQLLKCQKKRNKYYAKIDLFPSKTNK